MFTADNEAAIETLKKIGIKIVSPSDTATLEEYYKLGASARRKLVDRFFSQDLLSRVESALQEFRNSSGNKRE